MTIIHLPDEPTDSQREVNGVVAFLSIAFATGTFAMWLMILAGA